MTYSTIRRDRHDIVAEILKTAVGGRIKTHIMYRAKLSYSQVNMYLSFLVEKGFLENTAVEQNKQTKKVYKTTTKGVQLMESLESINNLWARRPIEDEST